MLEVRQPLALVVEDKKNERRAWQKQLSNQGFDTHAVNSAAKAGEWLETSGSQLDLLLVDLHLESENLGWEVIARSLDLAARNLVPSWCQRVVLTGYKETRAAAVAAPVKFFLKDEARKCFRYIRDEVWEEAKRRRFGEGTGFPDVRVAPAAADPTYEEKMACKALRETAASVTILGRPRGSLQKGVLLDVEVEPVHRECAGAKYSAIVKVGRSNKVRKELVGYDTLAQYFSNIGRFIPPPRKLVSLTDARETILLTPRVGGVTLYQFVQDCVTDLTSPKVTLLGEILLKLGEEFLAGIRTLVETKHAPDAIIQETYLCGSANAKRRFNKARPVLSDYLPSGRPLFRIKGDPELLVSPLFMLEEPSRVPWAFEEAPCWESRYGHGDFHVGNILVDAETRVPSSLDDVDLFVLDFDYVDRYWQHYDLAQLETSMLMAIALNEWPEGANDVWKLRLRPLLSALDKQELSEVADADWVCGIHGALVRLRGALSDGAFYDAALTATMLRILTSHHLNSDATLPKLAVRFGLMHLGMTLRRLVKIDALNGADADEVDL